MQDVTRVDAARERRTIKGRSGRRGEGDDTGTLPVVAPDVATRIHENAVRVGVRIKCELRTRYVFAGRVECDQSFVWAIGNNAVPILFDAVAEGGWPYQTEVLRQRRSDRCRRKQCGEGRRGIGSDGDCRGGDQAVAGAGKSGGLSVVAEAKRLGVCLDRISIRGDGDCALVGAEGACAVITGVGILSQQRVSGE